MDLVILALLLLAILSLINTTNSQKNKIQYMDEKLDKILNHLDIENNELDEKLMEFIDMGEIVAAVRICRERTGMDLKEAKEYVDKLAKE